MTELKKKYHAQAKKYYPARQRLTLPAKEGQKSGDVLKDSDQLSKYGLSNGSVVQFKDLGPQVRRGPQPGPLSDGGTLGDGSCGPDTKNTQQRAAASPLDIALCQPEALKAAGRQQHKHVRPLVADVLCLRAYPNLPAKLCKHTTD